MRSKIEYLVRIILFAVIYVVTAEVGLTFALDHGLATAVWPAAGLALVMLIKYGGTMWPAISLGAFTINLLHGGSVTAATQIAIGNTLEGIIILELIKSKEPGILNFARLRTTIFFILAILAGSAVSAIIGTSATAIFLNSGFFFTETIVTWWLGDAISYLIIIPTLFLFSPQSISELRNKKVVIFFTFLIGACYFTFFKNYLDSMTLERASVYSLIIFSLWAAVRHSGFIATLTVLTIFIFVLASTVLALGPFVQSGALENDLIIIQVLTVILAVTTLIVSAGIKEKTLIEDRLRDSLREKELLLTEIHHRVKNNLAIISSLLYFQEDTIADLETRKKFVETQGRIKSMALVHEKLYLNESFANIEFGSYIKDLTSSIEASYTLISIPVNLKLNIEEHRLDISKAIPCGLILNEILTNAFKYAFAGRTEGCIEINFSKNLNGYRLVVSDNGTGFDWAKKNKESLGLSLVGSLSEQLDATMEIKNENGTSFELSFN